jgi:hypothetical protein
VAIVTRERVRKEVAFRSRAEARTVLDAALGRVEADERSGPVLKAAGIRERLRLRDLDLTVQVSASPDPGRCIDWSFARGGAFDPALSLSMESGFANRWLQGRDSVAVAIARGLVQVKGGTGAALTHLPATRLLVEHYADVVASGYRHLLVD